DKGAAMASTIDWLEAEDILPLVLRSNLHHKQYVDQVVKIMRALLNQRRLLGKHLDAVWAATEKPDQFEAVKNNIFDLLAELAWSFSDEQLDSLFSRLQHIQGRSAADIAKLMQLVKKLARSDTRGVMASRLLQLLWMLVFDPPHTHAVSTGSVLAAPAPASAAALAAAADVASVNVLESKALTEVLGHYASVGCANKEEYMQRCLQAISREESVIPALQLLREIISLHPNPAPPAEEQQMLQAQLQSLNANHELEYTVLGSLQTYKGLARSLFASARSASPHQPQPMTAPSKPLPVSPVPPSSSSSPLPFSDASVLPSSDGSPMHGVVEQEEEEVRQECGGGDTTAERSLPTMDCDEPQGQQQQGQQRQRLQQEQKEQGQQQQQQQQQHVQLQRQLEQCTLVDGRHSHRDNITARLSFLLWALQAGGMELQPEGLRVIWTELVEHPACPDDRQLALTWLCDAVEGREGGEWRGEGGGRIGEVGSVGTGVGVVGGAVSSTGQVALLDWLTQLPPEQFSPVAWSSPIPSKFKLIPHLFSPTLSCYYYPINPVPLPPFCPSPSPTNSPLPLFISPLVSLSHSLAPSLLTRLFHRIFISVNTASGVLAVTPAPPGATPAPGLLPPAAALPVGAGAVAGGAAAGEGVQVAVAGDVGGLKGVELVWLLALRCPSPAIWQPCIQLLRDLHSSLVAPEKAKVVAVRQSFIGECMRRLAAAMQLLEGGTGAGHNGQKLGGHSVTVEGRSAGGVTPPTGRDALPMETSVEESDGGERTGDARDDGGGDVAMAGQEDEGGLEAREKEREGGVAGSGEMNGEGRGGKGGRSSKGGSSLEGQASAEEQAQRCLLLLTQFLTRSEASCPRKVPPHGASYQGRPFQVEVTVAHSKHVNFFVHTHANEYLRLLRLKVAHKLECDLARVRLLLDGHELLSDWLVLRQCGIADGRRLIASVMLNPRPRSRQQGEGGEAELPGVLMARQGEVYGTLFRLLQSANHQVQQAADELLMLLPTHRAILDDFMSIQSAPSAAEAATILTHLLRPSPRLVYTLQRDCQAHCCR
ncbi:unnamed protein product, partial [Closterium sp. NIES-53]